VVALPGGVAIGYRLPRALFAGSFQRFWPPVLPAGSRWWTMVNGGRLFTPTAALQHGSPTHLIGNLVTFLTVGFLLEPMIGIGWFSAIYFTAALREPAPQCC